MTEEKGNEIYKVTNITNDKVYVGITNQGIQTRFFSHASSARNGSNYHFHKAMRKYGLDSFKLELIETCDTIEELKLREIYWINFYDSTNPSKGYNITAGGEGGYGRVCSEETREKMRQRALGRTVSEEARLKMSLAHKGKPRSQEWIDSIRKGRKANLVGCKPVLVLNVHTGEEIEYNSRTEVDVALGLNPGTTSNHLLRNTICNDTYSFRSLNSPIIEKVVKVKKEPLPIPEKKAHPDSPRRKYLREIPYVDRTSEEYLVVQRNHPGCKEIGQYTLEGELLQTYKSANEAIRLTGISRSCLKHAVKGRNTSGGGFVWKYQNQI